VRSTGHPAAGGAGGGTGGALELRATADALLDAPLEASVRGAGGAELLWRARTHDDDNRVWRASAARPEELNAAWAPAKATTGAVAALRSLRPVALELRAEAADGRAAARTVRRRLVADGVRVRRWRDGVAGTLLLPARETPCAAVVVTPAAPGPASDAPTPRGHRPNADAAPGPASHSPSPLEARPSAAAPALLPPDALLPVAALLASRGALVFATAQPGDGERALELLAAIPAAGRAERPPRLLSPLPLPPGLPARVAADAAAWDALLAELGADRRA